MQTNIFVVIDVAGISASGITASIDIIGIAAGVMDSTIEWLNLCQSWTKQEPQGQWTPFTILVR